MHIVDFLLGQCIYYFSILQIFYTRGTVYLHENLEILLKLFLDQLLMITTQS